MKLDNLKINTLSPAAFDWYLRYLSAMDGGRASTLVEMIDDACSFQINNHLPMHGRAAIAAAFDRYWDAIYSIEHELLNIFGTDERFAVEMLCHYTRKDGTAVILPAAVFIDRGANGRIVYARSYVDATPVHDAFTRKYA